jgi:hypothetical protein
MAAFDPDDIARRGWRQGAVLDPALAAQARACAPASVATGASDWIIVTSHDCDIVARNLEKEPFVEVLRAVVLERSAPDKQQGGGRNPRSLQFSIDTGTAPVVLASRAHERWNLRRDLLTEAEPESFLPDRQRRLISEWLAKRYIRAAYPTAFDERWHSRMKDWTALLEKHSEWIQGVYLRLNTLSELERRPVARARGGRR